MGFDVLSVVIVLGLAILFHELGHFIVAKLLGVRVLKFSIGFGPRIAGLRRGHTEYILSAIPMGGYVKMAGDEWGQEHDDAPWEFLAQKPMHRNLIVLAGPFMNVVLAYFFYFLILAFWGQFYVATTEVGVVDAGSAAAMAGLQPGHRISSIGGETVNSWDDVMSTLMSGRSTSYEVQVSSATGKFKTEIKADFSEKTDPAASLPPVIGSLSPKGVAKSMAIEPGSTVVSVNGAPVATWEELRQAIAGLAILDESGEARPLALSLVWRDKSGKQYEGQAMPDVSVAEGTGEPQARIGIYLKFPAIYSDPHYVHGIGIAPSVQPLIGNVSRRSPAERGGLREGDRVLALDGEAVKDWYDFQQRISECFTFSNDGLLVGSDVRIDWLDSNGAMHSSTITTAVVKQYQEPFSGQLTPFAYIGVSPLLDRKYSGILSAFGDAAKTLVTNCWMFLLVIYRLIAGQVSPKILGGPIEIMRMAAQYGRKDMSTFLGFMAMVNLNLAVINLLPIPIVDGGHILLYSIEALRKKRFTVKQMEIATYIGLGILLPLILWVFVNDLSRIEWSRLFRVVRR